jgi:hypothetical protein
MRRNWPDIIHVTPGDENPVETTIDGMTATRYVINPDGSINGRVATARLDAGSEYHFRYQREAALAKLTQRQRIARLIRELRSTPNLCLDDSYAAGNCQPGTMQFCSQLGLAVDSAQRINGTALAKRWRQHNYPQVDRFAGAIAAAKKRLTPPVDVTTDWTAAELAEWFNVVSTVAQRSDWDAYSLDLSQPHVEEWFRKLISEKIAAGELSALDRTLLNCAGEAMGVTNDA